MELEYARPQRYLQVRFPAIGFFSCFNPQFSRNATLSRALLQYGLKMLSS